MQCKRCLVTASARSSISVFGESLNLFPVVGAFSLRAGDALPRQTLPFVCGCDALPLRKQNVACSTSSLVVLESLENDSRLWNPRY